MYHCDTNEANTGLRWLTGNIRRKLTLFVVLILIIVVGLFWFFSVFMLERAYHSSIRGDLSAALKTVAGIMDEMEKNGQPIIQSQQISDDLYLVRPSQELVDRLNTAASSGALSLNNRCLDIAGPNLKCLLLVDALESRCTLHPSFERSITQDGIHIEPEYDGETITRLRRQVFEQGEIYTVENGQIIMGRTTAGGQFSLVMSVNMERIPQAVEVLKRLLMPLSLLIILFSTMAAWGFSRWFTRPINKLSVAAKEMAKGNYDVRVEDCGDDEIGELAKDFNTMAREVGRSAALQRDLLANVSHDLRTPLTLIKGYAETVRDLTGGDEKKRTEQMNVIVDESDRLTALVGSVLELGRMSSGTEKPELVRFDLAELADEMSYRYVEACRQAGNHFEFSGDEGSYIEADPVLMERALQNLLDNAMKHVGADGFVGLRIQRTGYGMVRVEVSDHGPGISEQDLPHIFDRYYRSRDDAGKPGTGLGLSITKAIFNAHGFDFGVQSRVGEGATFWFEARLAAEKPR